MPETISLPLGGVLAAIVDFLRTQTPNDTGRVARDDRVGRDVSRDDGACADDRPFTDRDTRQYTHVEPDPRHAADADRPRRHPGIDTPGAAPGGAFEFPAA